MPFASQRAAIATPATPAEPARPRSGARAKARPPKNIAVRPIQAAKPAAESSGIASPSAASPKRFELSVVMSARTTIASQSRVRWAASFSRAMRRFPNGAAATKSRLPRRASPASVPDRAMIDQMAVPSTKIALYLNVTYPPRVPTSAPIFSTLPNSRIIDAGMLPKSASTSSRAAGVGKMFDTATPMTSAMPPSRPAAMMKARRESRIVLP